MAGVFSLDFGRAAARKADRFYLAYGSNLSLERMKSRCPDAVAFGTAVIPGYRLLFKKSKTGSYATIEQDANCCVPALVYKISELDEALLDRYEGYPGYYYKRQFRLSITRLDSGRRMKEKKMCMAYVMREERTLGEPGVEYFRLLDDGYSTWDFDTDILDKGLADSIGNEAAEKYIGLYLKGQSTQLTAGTSGSFMSGKPLAITGIKSD